MNPHSHSGVTHTVQGLEIMHKSKQDHTTFSFLNVIVYHQIGHLMNTCCAKMFFTAIKVGAARKLSTL